MEKRLCIIFRITNTKDFTNRILKRSQKVLPKESKNWNHLASTLVFAKFPNFQTFYEIVAQIASTFYKLSLNSCNFVFFFVKYIYILNFSDIGS